MSEEKLSKKDIRKEKEDLAWGKLKQGIDEKKIYEAVFSALKDPIDSNQLKAIIDLQKSITKEAMQVLTSELKDTLSSYDVVLNMMKKQLFILDEDQGEQVTLKEYVIRKVQSVKTSARVITIACGILAVVVGIVALVK